MATLGRWRVLSITLFIFAGLALIADGCLQFRMSETEIRNYFKNANYPVQLKQYKALGRSLTYLEAGADSLPLVVFVHGSPGSLSAFIHFLKDTTLLSRAQLIAVDRPGFGSSGFGFGERSLEKQAAMLKPVLEAHSTQRPIILVGHSLGGPVVARIAMDYPGLVDGLVMVAPSIDPDLEPVEWYRPVMATPPVRWLLPRSMKASNEEIYKLDEELREMVPRWADMHVNTIVIQGMKDNLVDPGNAQFAQQHMTHAPVTLVVIEDLDHFVPWNRPDLIRSAILKQLERE